MNTNRVLGAALLVMTGFAACIAAQQWPKPIEDNARYSYALVDILEYQRVCGVDALRWDFLGWHGGDRQRLWLKSEGELYPGALGGGEADFQALYGKLVTPFFDLQTGLRVEQHYEPDRKPVRGFLVLGVQGLAPYRFDIEPTLFLSNRGNISVRFTGSYDLLLTQRLVLQPRFETEIAAQEDVDFGVPRWFNDVEAGFRVRYEIRREFAPYVGVLYRQSFDIARDRVIREGGAPSGLVFVLGIRTWH